MSNEKKASWSSQPMTSQTWMGMTNGWTLEASGSIAKERLWRASTAIFRKDWRSELRTRYAISALVMFVITTISIILFSLGSEGAPLTALSGMLWVVVFFAAMS